MSSSAVAPSAPRDSTAATTASSDTLECTASSSSFAFVFDSDDPALGPGRTTTSRFTRARGRAFSGTTPPPLASSSCSAPKTSNDPRTGTSPSTTTPETGSNGASSASPETIAARMASTCAELGRDGILADDDAVRDVSPARRDSAAAGHAA